MSARSDEGATAGADARILELGARRRARLRWLALRGGIVAGALVLVLGLGAAWLLNTVGGRDLLLAQIVSRLPADATLGWERAEGPASGPLTLHGLRFAYGKTTFAADTVYLDPAVRPLFRGQLRLDALRIRGAVLSLPASDEPFQLPEWPGSLPGIAPPIAVQADDVQVDALRVLYDGARVLDVSRLRTGLDVSAGALRVERLVLDSDRGRFTLHGDYRPRDEFRMDLRASAHVPARDGKPEARVGVIARGNATDLQLAVAGSAPAPLRASLALRGRDRPVWTGVATSQGFDAALFTTAKAGEPLVFDLRADGVAGTARLGGRLQRGDLRMVLQPSIVLIRRQRIELKPLALEMLGGHLAATGFADFADPRNARLRARIVARDLVWGEAPAAGGDDMRVRADAHFGLAGTTRRWAAIGKATLQRGDQAAQVDFDARGDGKGARIETLAATMPTGRLDATGTVAWSPVLAWTADASLAGFDPGYFAPAWNGAVDGTLRSTGGRAADGGFNAVVDARNLRGRLRDRALDGRGRVVIHLPPGDAAVPDYEGEIDLRLGDSRVTAKGRIARSLDVDARFAPLHLADLWPDAAGVLRGELQLRGARSAPDLDVDLVGEALRWGDYRAGRLVATGRLPWTRGGRAGDLHLQGDDLQLGLPVDSLLLDARGAVEDLAVQATLRGGFGTLAVDGSARKRGVGWAGRLAGLDLAPATGARWRLQQPAAYRWDGRNGALEPACLASSAGGTLCANADWPRRGLDVRGAGLPLALLQDLLPARADGRPWLLRGELEGDARVRPVGGSWRGEATLRSATGGVASGPRSGRRAGTAAARDELLRYDALLATATFGPAGIDATLGAGFGGRGRVDATIATGWDANAPLRGTVAIDTDEITWLELFSPDIVAPTGTLSGRLALAGTRAQPRLGGNARLSAFRTELPALGLALRDGTLALDALPDGSARVDGQVRSGGGLLRVQGTLGWGDAAAPLRLRVTGENVLVSDTRELRAVADPDLSVVFASGDTAVTVTGTVTVPSARIDLERLDQGERISPDVVILDPAEPNLRAVLGLDLDLALVAGDDVRLKGFGLDGALSGRLQVRARPGREVLASGQLDVDGTYVAYGSRLAITRGRLRWTNSPVVDPLLDVRAERTIGAVIAGVDVRGRASAPVASVWTNPSSSPSEAIAYLALGRPLATASREEGDRVSAARNALSIGGNLLVSQLGARIGLDDAGVSQSRALGGEVIGAGKYLSPKLYVSYGVALLGTGQVITLKYLLRKGFDIEIESSSVENRASLNWRKER